MISVPGFEAGDWLGHDVPPYESRPDRSDKNCRQVGTNSSTACLLRQQPLFQDTVFIPLQMAIQEKSLQIMRNYSG
jgi:hypothetical protein